MDPPVSSKAGQIKVYSAKSNLDTLKRMAAIEASDCVVSLTVYSALGKKKKRRASGTIIDTTFADNVYSGVILTSASLIKTSPKENAVINELKVDVFLPHGEVVNGELELYDFQYNIAILKVKSNSMLWAAHLKLLDDSQSIDSIDNPPGSRAQSFQLRAHTEPHNSIFPGDTVVILGRMFKRPYETIAFFGEFCIDCCYSDCHELLRVNCRVTECSVGGPVINLQGELIGMVHHHDNYTPFLPINIISKLFDYYKVQRVFCKPCTGLVVVNLYASELNTYTEIVSEFPDINYGVLVEEVEEASPAHSAQLRPNDLIVRCDGKDVCGTIQFHELILEKVGRSVELTVLRAAESRSLVLTLNPQETKHEKLNRLIMDCFPCKKEKSMGSSKLSSWKRKHDVIGRDGAGIYRIMKHSSTESFYLNVSANIDLDFITKRAVQGVSNSVVSIICCSGENESFFGSGTIVEVDVIDGIYWGLILTSASLIRQSPNDHVVAQDIKLKVLLSKGLQCDGDLIDWDLHYNIALVRIKSETRLKAAHLKALDDSMSLDLNALPCSFEETLKARISKEVFNIYPGDKVIAVGRYFKNCYEIMAAPGVFSANMCGSLDCKELLRADCRNKKVGIGGPLINTAGEVVGILFYAELFTPFLSINVALRLLEQYKNHIPFKRPFLGMEFANLYTARLGWIEKFSESFPDIFKGIVVKKVTPNSSADVAGLRYRDVIVKCDGEIVQGNLQFFEMIRDKVGSKVELTVLRASDDSSLSLSIVPEETLHTNYNRWPLPEERMVKVRGYRM